MARHVVYEVMIDPSPDEHDSDADWDQLRDRLNAVCGEYGTTVCIVFQTNDTTREMT